MTAELNVDKAIASSVNAVLKRYHGHVTRQDLTGEARKWVLEHPGRIESLSSDDRVGRAFNRLKWTLTGFLSKYAEAEKAAQSGYDPVDQFSYNERLLEIFLPAVYANDPLTPVRKLESRSGRVDPREGGNWAPMYADVSRAWETADLTRDQRDMLIRRFVDETPLDQLGWEFGLTRASVKRALRRAVSALLAPIGGAAPLGCPFDCECHEGRLRRRPGVHRADDGIWDLMS